jgi:hypothetical protein
LQSRYKEKEAQKIEAKSKKKLCPLIPLYTTKKNAGKNGQPKELVAILEDGANFLLIS